MKLTVPTMLLFTTFCVQSSDWPEVEFPMQAKVQIVADEMLYNGYPMKLWSMDYAGSHDELVNYFIAQWQNNSERFDAQPLGADYVINSLQPPFLLTARIKNHFDASSAVIGITKNVDDRRLPAQSRNKFPTPSGTDVISDIQSTDMYKKGRTLVMLSDKGLSRSYHFYRDHYERSGWQEVSGILAPSEGKAVLQMNKQTATLDISFAVEGSEVYIVANHVFKGDK